MTTGMGPYVLSDAEDPLPTTPGVFEFTITTSLQTRDIGAGVMANVETYNGEVPGPTIRLTVGDTLIVRLKNNLPHDSGIHWHGIEMLNSADGTPVTQNGVPPGGTYLYMFTVPRPGIFWYHPHHHHSTNRVLRGSYGMIVVTDPNEATLVSAGTIPAAADTLPLLLSDITVCKAVMDNDSATYNPALPFLSSSTVQPGPSPEDLCELSPLNEDGSAASGPFAAGDVPNIQRAGPGRTNEGQTILTNGVNVGARAGEPSAPGALGAAALTRPVDAGQGLRMQVVNAATTRFFRLILTTSTGAQVPLVRIGGEGGLLNDAVVEGGVLSGFDTKITSGEIMLPPASRADFVAAIPASATGTLTLWTQDLERTGAGYSVIPTQPVAHFEVTGTRTPYTIGAGTALLSSVAGASLTSLPGPFGSVLDPGSFSPTKPGLSTPDIQLTNAGGVLGINGIGSSTGGAGPYSAKPHFGSARYGEFDTSVELTVSNTTGAHHPFHMHGFSVQPISLTPGSGAPAGSGSYVWAYVEYRDNIDVPSQYVLTARVHFADRPLHDGTTMGGAFGRWLFHCHIFFHAHQGMISELVVTANGGGEKPFVDVGGSWAYAPFDALAERHGTFGHPDPGETVNLTTSLGVLASDPVAGTWDWEFDSTGMTVELITFVFITAEDGNGRRDQTVFRLKIGGTDDGSDNGDPHIHTVDGQRYDFQAVGEFIALRDRMDLEVQTRQTPVLTANPITDSHSGLKTCVSLNTAVAARVGGHHLSYQPNREGDGLQFYLNGKPAQLPTSGLDLPGGHRISTFDSDGELGLRVDYAQHAVLTVTPRFWTSHSVWYMDVSVSNTQADEGLMGSIPQHSWLPTLSSGATVGSMPASLSKRYEQLYKTFADSWRVDDASSLFVYERDTSTATFTDRGWPAESPPCVLQPGFEMPGVPLPAGMPLAQAEQVCQAVTLDGLHTDCVFDVATTGDESFAEGYLFAQDLKLRGTRVQLVEGARCPELAGRIGVTAIVLRLTSGRPTPKGQVRFFVDGVAESSLATLDAKGRACFDTSDLTTGDHDIRAAYEGGEGAGDGLPSSSPTVVVDPDKQKPFVPQDSPGPDPGGTGSGGDDLSDDTSSIRIGWLLLLALLALVLYLIFFS